jgi:Pro-Pro endopeptidase
MSSFSRLGFAALLLGLQACAADSDGAAEEFQDSTANGISCEVRLDALTTENLHGIEIDEDSSSKRIPKAEKIRHLNELNRLPTPMLDVFRTFSLPIHLTAGAVTNFRQFRSLRGQTPRGWEGTGQTWDVVPGTGNATGVYLGDSAKPNGTASLAIHEGTHAIDLRLRLTENSRSLQRLYRRELARPLLAGGLESYRRSHIEEFLAVAVDQYYCSANTRRLLKGMHPEMATYVENELQDEIQTASAALHP